MAHFRNSTVYINVEWSATSCVFITSNTQLFFFIFFSCIYKFRTAFADIIVVFKQEQIIFQATAAAAAAVVFTCAVKRWLVRCAFERFWFYGFVQLQHLTYFTWSTAATKWSYCKFTEWKTSFRFCYEASATKLFDFARESIASHSLKSSISISKTF